MPKIQTLPTATGNPTASQFNDAMSKITTALNNTVSRDGSVPNSISSDMDFNSNDILNVKDISITGTFSVDGQPMSTSVFAKGFETRADFVEWANDTTVSDGVVVAADGYWYIKTGASAISDVSGWEPFGNIYPQHFGNVDGTADQVQINLALTYAGTLSSSLRTVPVIMDGNWTVSAPIRPVSYTALVAQGWGHIKLANSSNCTVIETENFSTLSGSGSASGTVGFILSRIKIDGNRANQSPGSSVGHGVAIYGRDNTIEDLQIKGTYRRALWTEYASSATGTSPFNWRLSRLLVDQCGEDGWYNKASDIHAVDINVRRAGLLADNTYSAILLSSSGGARLGKINIWSNTSENCPAYGLNVDGPQVTGEGIHIETTRTAGLRLISDSSQISAFIYNNTGKSAIVAGSGNMVEIAAEVATVGDATETVLTMGVSGTVLQNSIIHLSSRNFTGSVIDPTYSGGYNSVHVNGYQASGTLFTGTSPESSDRFYTSGFNAPQAMRVFGGHYTSGTAVGPGAVIGNTGATAVGNQASASGVSSTAIGNICSTSSGALASFAYGSRASATIYGEAAHAGGMFAAAGDRMTRLIEYSNTTTNATPTELFTDGSSTFAALANNSSWVFTMLVQGRNNSTNDIHAVKFEGVIRRGANAAATVLVTSTKTVINAIGSQDVAISADTTNGSLKVQATGAAATTIRWFATMTVNHASG